MPNEYEGSLNAFAVLMQGQGEATIRHCLRLREACSLLGQEMGLGSRALRDLEDAALLHDIGLLRVPIAVRAKPAPLSEEEWREIRRHPDLGAELVAEITTMEGAAELIRCHHERWDGGGYPRGLAGKDIPVGARILSVVDAFDAIQTSQDTAGEAAARAALEEIRRHAGSQFDPAVVDALARALPRVVARRTRPA